MRDIVQNEESKKPSWAPTELEGGLPAAKVKFAKSQIDWDNPKSLARVATASIADETDYLNANDYLNEIPRRRYVWIECRLAAQRVPMGISARARVAPTAAFCGFQ